MKDTLYGSGIIFSDQPIPTQDADRILGCQLRCDTKGRPEWIDLQFQTAEPNGFRQVTMDYPNALFLLSCLKSMQLDCGTPFPDDPRGG